MIRAHAGGAGCPGSATGIDTINAQGIVGDVPDWIRIEGGTRPGLIRVEVLEHLRLHLDSLDRSCAWYWRTKSGEDLKIGRQPSLMRPLADSNVLALLGQAQLEQSAENPYERKASPKQCAEVMAHRIEFTGQFRLWIIEWERALYATLGDTLKLAVHSSPADIGDISTEHFERVWRHQEAFMDVRSKAPNLLPLLGLWLSAGHRLEESEGPLGQLKQSIIEIPDCGQGTWRWLHRWGARSLISFIRGACPNGNGKSQWIVLFYLLELWGRAGLPPPLPAALTEVWGQMIPRPSSVLSGCPERLAILAQYLNDTRSSRLEGLEIQNFADSLMRIQDPLPPLDRNQKRAGWAWLRRDLQRFSLSVPCVVPCSRENRPVLTKAMVVSGVRFVPLLEVGEIEEEGFRLQHCMGIDPHCFAESADLHFSLRCPETDQSLATCSFSHSHERLRLCDFSGVNNARPSVKLYSVVEAFCNVLWDLHQQQSGADSDCTTEPGGK